jgi:hypothetical protein
VEAGAILGRVEAAEEDRSHSGIPLPFPVGNDTRALFYRTAHQIHSLVVRLVPGAALPGKEGPAGLPYRCLRACFRLLEPLFSPRLRP